MTPKTIVSAERLNQTIIESTMKTMKIEGRLPDREPIIRIISTGNLVRVLKSHSPRSVG
ncbi:hypothetical protein [Subtercola boreus]|uniref:hypothetical protein n=1 Tax=Subtercola boreus TaxID=120213 RepID=UPI001559A2DE|nr:hypothetical protein [Subtercola boreus]